MKDRIHWQGGLHNVRLPRPAGRKPVGLPACMTKTLRELCPRKPNCRGGLRRRDIVLRDLMPGMIPARQCETLLEIFETELPRDERALLGKVGFNLRPGDRASNHNRGVLSA